MKNMSMKTKPDTAATGRSSGIPITTMRSALASQRAGWEKRSFSCRVNSSLCWAARTADRRLAAAALSRAVATLTTPPSQPFTENKYKQIQLPPTKQSNKETPAIVTLLPMLTQ